MKLRKLRISRRLTQDKLSHVSGVSLKTVTNMERGTHPPKLETMLKISKALDVELADIDEFQQRIAA